MDRPPIASAEAHAWVWYKNCVLPPLKVICTAQGLPLENLSCLLSAVRVDVSGHAAHDVGLEGDTLRPLVHGSCSFSSLSFKTTSYNLKGKPLHLMATLLMRTGASGHLCVVCSWISPPVIVNARKRQAKERSAAKSSREQTGGEPGGDVELLPFAPDLLERKMEKVEKGERNEDGMPQVSSRRQIDNSLEGLRAYLSALNIRNKCKHPLFLVLRFDSCLRLLYDSTKVLSPLQDDSAFYRMMEILSAGDPLCARSVATGGSTVLAPFVIAVRATHYDASYLRTTCQMQLTSLFSLPHAAALPPSYKELCDLQIKELRHTYFRLYCEHLKNRISFPPAAVPRVCDPCDQTLWSKPDPPPSMSYMAKAAPTSVYSAEARLDTSNSADAKAQRHGMALVASLHQLATDTEELEGCPEQEWEHQLLVLAEAMSQLCHTRSAAEIVAFMKGDRAGASKRLATSRAELPVAAHVVPPPASNMLMHVAPRSCSPLAFSDAPPTSDFTILPVPPSDVVTM